MDDKELKLARKKYNKLKNAKQNYLNKKDELEQLKNDPNVIRFLELSKYFDKHSEKEFEENNMISKSFSNIASRTEKSNNILVFLGFIDNYDSVTIHPKQINYVSFMDLESMEPYNIHPAYYDEFCEDKRIVYFDDPWTYHNSEYYMQNFFELRNKFFKNLVDLDKEKTIQKILKKH